MKIDAPPVSPRARGGWLSTLANRFSVKSQMLVGAGLGILFALLAAAFLNVSQRATIRRMNSLVNVDNVVSDLCLKSDAAMRDVRRLEKDFQLNYATYGADEAFSRYVTRLASGVEGIKENMARVRELAKDPAMQRLTLEVDDALDHYRAGVEAVAQTFAARGSPDAGVCGEVGAAAGRIEKSLEAPGRLPLVAGFAAARVAQFSYLEREKDGDAAAVERALRQFAAAAGRLPEAQRAELAALTGRYLAAFRSYVSLTEQIRSERSRYLETVRRVEQGLGALYARSLARVATQRREIEEGMRRTSLPIVVGGGLAVALAALLALGVARAVTSGLDESQAFAAKIAAGNLGTRVTPTGRSEFFALQTALNAMAEALQNAEHVRKAGLAALRESEEKYRALVETSADWIWATDREGRHTYSNDRIRDILGIEPQRLPQLSRQGLVHPEDAPRMADLLARGVDSGTGWRGVVLRWRHRDGTLRWLESNAVALKDVDGGLVGFQGVDRDVTERRQLEVERGRAQRLEAVGTLAGGIAHDFNNLLQGVFGFVSLAKLSLPPGDKALGMLEQAEKALGLSANLTNQLLTFAKGGKPIKQRIALGPLLEDPVRFALSGSPSGYRLSIDDGLRAVDADAGQIAQVIQNLVLNASEAMPRGGTVEIGAHNESLPAGEHRSAPAGGAFVRIDVRDRGVGIEEQNLPRIFEPYFTTKQKGSGLGLASSYAIVRSHGGFIDVHSRAGEGALFSVYLPACDAAAAPALAPAPEPGPQPVGPARKILVMDDEDVVREVAQGMLVALGHEVRTAASGEEALALFRAERQAGRPFDVVMLDLTVKNGMGGEEAIRHLREIDPDVKAVVSSGYSSSAVVSDYRAHGFSAFLNKPYRLEALRGCLQPLLSPSGPS